MEVLTYVPSNVCLFLSGYEIKGWTEIKVSRNAPGYRQIRGIRAKHTRTRILDRSAKLTITVFQSEPVNEVLSIVHGADMQTGAGRLEIMLKEITGTSIFTTTTAYITGYPEMSYSGKLATNTWEIACDEATISLGNSTPGQKSVLDNAISKVTSLF